MHNLGKIEAQTRSTRGNTVRGTRDQHRAIRAETGRTVITRLTGAVFRASLVMAAVILPSVLVPGTDADARQMVALVGIFAAVLTLVEYNAAAPGLIEFRDAPPFNRLRFVLLLSLLGTLALIERGRTDPSSSTALVEALGLLFGHLLDFPGSPVRLVVQMLSPGATEAQVLALRTAAATAYMLSLIVVALFVIRMRTAHWPRRARAFNVWINLPTFDPTTGHDIITRLERDARFNVFLGVVLPFLIPALVRYGMGGIHPAKMTEPQTLIWTMTAWSFLSASLLMRGIAMNRVAVLIREKRRATQQALAEDDFATI